MRFSLRVFGLDLLTIEASTEDAEEPDGGELAGGTTSAYPLGFCASPGDQRWEKGLELE